MFNFALLALAKARNISLSEWPKSVIASDGKYIGIHYTKDDGEVVRACTNDDMKLCEVIHKQTFNDLTKKQLLLICKLLQPHIKEFFNEDDK